MALQQLDLFGNPIPQQTSKAKPKQMHEDAVASLQEVANKPQVPLQKVETVYESLVKRKRGRPRKTTEKAVAPKVNAKRGRKPYLSLIHI